MKYLTLTLSENNLLKQLDSYGLDNHLDFEVLQNWFGVDSCEYIMTRRREEKPQGFLNKLDTLGWDIHWSIDKIIVDSEKANRLETVAMISRFFETYEDLNFDDHLKLHWYVVAHQMEYVPLFETLQNSFPLVRPHVVAHPRLCNPALASCVPASQVHDMSEHAGLFR